MKKILIISFFLFALSSLFAQVTPVTLKQKKKFELPKTLFNLDLNYSTVESLSSKITVGSNNTGILIRADWGPNVQAFGLGYQKSIIRGLYGNVSANIHRQSITYSDSFYNYVYGLENIEYAWSINTGLGYTLSLGKAKRIYLNTEIVFNLVRGMISEGSNSFTIPPFYNFLCGIGYRFGSPAKTSFSGIKNITTVPLKP
jgi:hypothetical protein